MRTALLIIPALAVLYFVWQARTSRIFLLGIPFLMFFRQSLFFDQMRPFWTPGRFSDNTLAMLWLIAVWALCTGVLLPRRSRELDRRTGPFGPRLLPEEVVLIAIGAVTALGIVLTSLSQEDPLSALGEGSGLLYMLLGYALVRGIVCHSSRSEIMRFLDAIVTINTIAAALFIVHQGLHIEVYGGQEYFTTVFQGQTITRTFSFMSPLLIFGLAVALTKRTWNWWTYGVVIINLVAIWISYTRTMVVMAALVAAIAVGVRLFVRGQGAIAVRRAVATVVVVLCVAVVVVTFLPTETNYFVSRIQKAMTAPSVTTAGSLGTRSSNWGKAYDIVSQDSIVLGSGFVSAAQDPLQLRIVQFSWDSAWVAVIYRLGLVGLVLFVVLFAVYSARALLLLMRGDPWEQDYGLLWFAYLVAFTIGSFIGWGFMDATRYPMNLWFLAFISGGVLLGRLAQPAAAVEPDGVAASARAAGATTPLVSGGR